MPGPGAEAFGFPQRVNLMSLGLVGPGLKRGCAGLVSRNGKEILFIISGSSYLFLKYVFALSREMNWSSVVVKRLFRVFLAKQ